MTGTIFRENDSNLEPVDFTEFDLTKNYIPNYFNVLGECDCKSEYLRYLDSEENLSCHLEFTQGPCENDQVLMQPEMNETDEIMENSICIPKICMEIEMCFYDDASYDLGKFDFT